MIERHDVISAYRYMLAREPENEAVIERRLAVRDWVALRDLIRASPEYKAKQFLKPPERYVLTPPLNIDVTIPEEKFQRLLAHVQAVWERVGNDRPHWSVLTVPEYLPERIDENREQFYASGADFVSRLDAALQRAAKTLSGGRCLELGCGVGRVTAHLASRFAHVVGVDISTPHLALAKAYLSEQRIENVTLQRLSNLSELESFTGIDVLYSTFVLQHNPPPIMYAVLDKILTNLNPGAFAFFQVPVYGDGYSFTIDDYIAGLDDVGRHGIEMHVLPQRYLFSLFEKHAMRLLDLIDDGGAGNRYLSHQVLAQKAE